MCRTVLLFGVLLSLSSPVQGAALSDASLQGTYIFALEKIDTPILFGPLFTTATGTLSFDGNGNLTAQGFIDRDTTLQSFDTTGTYRLEATGAVRVSLAEPAVAVVGSVSFDLSSLIASSVGGGNLQTQQILLATRQPVPPFTPALLNGNYSVAERTITTGGSPQLENSVGTIRFDGVGNAQVELTRNRGGSSSAISGTGTYQVLSDGRALLNIPGRAGPVTLAVSPDSRLAVGATTSPASLTTHDLWVLTRTGDSGLGDAGLDGSYQIIAGAFSVSRGFSTATGTADYKGNGTGSYQMTLNTMGVLQSGAGNSSFSIPASRLQFLDLEKFLSAGAFPETLRMGLSDSGLALVAASVSDPSANNFLIAIRTPSQPTAATNAASFSADTALSPGGLFSLFGRNLARQTTQAPFVGCPGTGDLRCLPRQLGGATLKVGGIEAPLVFVSPFQINAQLPFEVPPGPVTITVVMDGVESGPLPATVQATTPAVFTTSQSGTGQGVFQNGRDFSLVTESNPARRGDVIIVYSTGLGAVLPQAASGSAAPSQPLSSASASVTAEIGGQNARVHFAGLAPDFVGLYQVNVEIPVDLSATGNVPLVLRVAGTPSNPVTIPIF
ncbi:MAG: hypothetical protein HY647_01055 [Acidobacteria bacterium]|nr:hypothetical protein [Acidobacteriota bacterium]